MVFSFDLNTDFNIGAGSQMLNLMLEFEIQEKHGRFIIFYVFIQYLIQFIQNEINLFDKCGLFYDRQCFLWGDELNIISYNFFRKKAGFIELRIDVKCDNMTQKLRINRKLFLMQLSQSMVYDKFHLFHIMYQHRDFFLWDETFFLQNEKERFLKNFTLKKKTSLFGLNFFKVSYKFTRM